jgi:hypothetical protein
VKENLVWIVLAIVVITVTPAVLQYLRERREGSRPAP